MIHRLWVYSAILTASGLFLGLDYLTGPTVFFPIAFVLPIALAAWYLGLWSGIVCSSILTSLRLVFGTTNWGTPELTLKVQLLNAAIQLVVFVGLSWMTNRLARQTRELAQRVEKLEGLLPICSHCKSIREPDGGWIAIEKYIAERSKATFSHGICDGCLHAHYPDFAASIVAAKSRGTAGAG